MNKFPMTPDENRIEALLMNIQPAPSEAFHQKMKRATWRAGVSPVVKNIRLKVAFAVVTFATITILLITPEGRAWAQDVMQFFTRINTLSIPLSVEDKERMYSPIQEFELPLAKILTPSRSPSMAGLPECENPQNAQSYACQIAYAESQVGFDMKELPVQPDDWEINLLKFDPIAKTTILGYKMDITLDYTYQRYSQFILIQSVGDKLESFFNMPVATVPADKVETVKVGPYNGEYVSGGFQLSTDSTELVWDDTQLFQRLAWSDGIRWYLIEYMSSYDTPNSIQREQLLDIAVSLVNKPVLKTGSLNPDMLDSVSDAEKISGLDLKAPTLLPLGVDFSTARYFPASHEVHLQYGVNNELVIYEWEGKSINFDTLPTPSNKDYAIVEVNGKKAFYGYSSGTTPYWFLSWREHGLNYKIYFYRNISMYGGILNKEKMIAIAESMSDINAVRGGSFRPYEYVAIYEQSLGFDVKEFPITPPGWSFTQVSAYAHPACIIISYTAEKESGWLSSRQCSTDISKYFDLYHIPRSAIERVKIGDHKGQYIIGSIEYGDSGKPAWNPNLPFRRLIWQENGFWYELTLSGDSVVLHDKEDLISYAESLR